jgi:two-component system, sensor histidine kinase
MLDKSKVNVLAVDDRKENLMVLEHSLKSPIINIVKAESGRQALELIKNISFALILMDVQMPEMNGFETAERVRKNDVSKSIPIIFVTAISKDDKYVFEGYKLGAVDYITKPFNPLILKSKVDVFIELFKQKQELENVNEVLEKRVELRTRELNTAKEKAELANIAKSRFLSNISHELLTPLHGAQSYSKFGIAETEKGSNEKLYNYFSSIDESCERLRLMLDDLLTLSRFQADQVTFKMAVYDIKYIVKSVCDSLIHEINKKSIQLHIEETTIDLNVWGDLDKLSSLFWHLISNAIKYSENEKSIKISFNRNQHQFIDDKKDAFEISIEDHGVGIPENELELIFENFSESSKTATNAGGKGLGLSICREIVKAHHGKIWVENLSQGAIFKVLLPVDAIHK